MKCLEILLFIRRKCNDCFKNNPPHPQNQHLSQSLLELRTIPEEKNKTNSTYNKANSTDSKAKPGEIERKQISIVQIVSDSESEEQVKMPQKGSKAQEQPVKEQEFLSIQSFQSTEKSNKITSSQRLISQLSKLKIKGMSSKELSQRNSESNYSSQQSQIPPADRINISQQTQKFREWISQQYGKPRYASFRISHAVRLRMHGYAMAKHIIHKFDDFQLNYLYESGEGSGFNYINESKTLEAEFHLEQFSSHLRRQKVISYFKIKCFTNNFSAVLETFNSKKLMKVMHNFSSVKTVEYEGGGLGINLPILQASQSDHHSKQNKTYHIATQIDEMLKDTSGKNVVEVSYSLDQGEDSWQRVIKVLVGISGQVQIYCQSFEQLSRQVDLQLYFEHKFSSLLRYLTDRKILQSK